MFKKKTKIILNLMEICSSKFVKKFHQSNQKNCKNVAKIDTIFIKTSNNVFKILIKS